MQGVLLPAQSVFLLFFKPPLTRTVYKDRSYQGSWIVVCFKWACYTPKNTNHFSVRQPSHSRSFPFLSHFQACQSGYHLDILSGISATDVWQLDGLSTTCWSSIPAAYLQNARFILQQQFI